MHDNQATRRLVWPATLAVFWLGLTAWSVPAGAGDLGDLVEEVLDQSVDNVRIERQFIREALGQLGEQTGLRFELDDAALAWMPYGERTRVSIVIQGGTLRQGLREMLDGLGLAMRVEGDKVRVGPAPVLDRLGRRLSIEEVHSLQSLASTPWSELDEDHRSVVFRAISGPDPQQALDDTIAQVRAPNALRQLEAATQNLAWHWVPQDDAILIYSRAEDVWHRLERPISLAYRGMRLDDVLIDLGDRVGVTVMFEGGVLERIQASSRSLDLVHRDTTVLQTLERICGATGTCFEVQEYGVLIGSTQEQGATRRAAGPRVVAILRVPVGADGTTVDFPFYEDDVPPEFQRLLDRKLPEVLGELQQREGK